ncbi:MAG: DNA polymerase I [Nitrospiraceae bacterium]|nr:DNA polymerase I [Nitrospiraceae bacterium]
MDIYLIDGSSYIYRAYFAVRGLTDSGGRPTNAIFGFTNMLLKVIRDLKPGGMAMVFDTPQPTERHRIYEAYKAHRPETPGDLVVQIPAIKKIVEAFRIKRFELPGCEADDVIATLAERLSKEGNKVFVVSADKDLLQLVNGDIKVYDPVKNAVFDAGYVLERFGVPPEKVPDYMALVGDAADNIPGVKGIGEKTARALFAQFGSLDGIMEHPEQIKKERTRKLIEEGMEAIRVSRRLATVDRALPLDIRASELELQEPDWRQLLPMFKDFEFTSLMKYIPGAAPREARCQIIRATEDLRRILPLLQKGFALKIESDLPPISGQISGLAIAADTEPATENFYVPFGHPGMMEPCEAIELIKPLLEDESVPKTGHDLKREAEFLAARGVTLKGPLYDTMLASYLANPVRGEHGLESAVLEFLGMKKQTMDELRGKGGLFGRVDVDKAAGFACQEAGLAALLRPVLFGKLSEENLDGCYNAIEMPLINVLARMELAGVKVDRPRLENFSGELGRALEGLKQRIYFHAGCEFNINSPRQLGHILFHVLGLAPGKKKKTGYSTDVGVLEELAKSHELPREVLEWRALFKLKSTYVDVLPNLVNPKTGRIHTSFQQAVTATGRLSSTDPNLQNIPIKGEWGRKIREAFVPEEGFLILSADYSQIELRVLAHLSRDEELIRLFKAGADIHATTAAGIFGAATADITPEMRRAAKGINFGIVYGITPFGLSESAGVEKGEAAIYIEKYFERHPGVKAYLASAIGEARRTGYCRTLCGRKRPIPELKSKDRRIRALGERLAMNSPIQGTAADIIKKAMIGLSARLQDERYSCNGRARLILQVHDELVIECPEDRPEEYAAIVREEMEKAAGLAVPVVVDAGYGKNWAQAH